MKISPIQAVLAAVAIVAAAGVAHVAVPRELMAVPTEAFDLERVVPRQFGEWAYDSRIRLVEPPEDGLGRQLYSQEIGRGYRDREGNLVMLLVAYGPNQTSRLQLHRPELCYTAEGFRLTKSTPVAINYDETKQPLNVLRLIARREARVEPISYWVRVGDDITNSIWGRQLSRLKLTLRNKIADGALMRVSTIGVSENVSFDVQDRFIRDFYEALAPQNRAFFFGGERTYSQTARSGGAAQ
jgi:EpsI family protein